MCSSEQRSSLIQAEMVQMVVVKDELAKAKRTLKQELEDRMGLESRLKHAELAVEEELARRKSLENLLNERKVFWTQHSKPSSVLDK